MTNISMKKAPSVKRNKIISLDKKKARAGWIFVLPFVIGFALIYLPVIYDSLKYSFCQMVKSQQGVGYNPVFVGFQNYKDALFTDTEFVKVLVSGIKQLLFDVPAIVIFSLFMAVLLNKKMFGRAAFRAIFFIPVILSTGLIANIDAANTIGQYMSTTTGIDDGSGSSAVDDIVGAADLSWLFSNMAVGTELLTYVTGIVNSIYDIVNRSGVQMLIFLAGLQSVSPAIYESCSIDGATGWETFWKITFPMVSPMILVNTVYTVIDSFTVETNSVMMYIEETYNSANGDVLSTAMAWIYFIIVLLIIAIVAALVSAFVFYQKRD